MLERRKEFGLRNGQPERRRPEPSAERALTFDELRGSLNALRAKDAEVDDLVTRLEELEAYRGVGENVPADQLRKEQLQQQVVDLYQRKYR